MNSVTDKYCPLLLLPVKLWAGARLTNISIRMTGHKNVGKIYILAPVYSRDNKTFIFIRKAGHRIVGSLSQATVNYKIVSIWKIDIVNVGLINTYNRIMILIEDICNTCPCR